MKILIFGCTGFIGNQLRADLQTDNHEVLCVSRSQGGHRNHFQGDILIEDSYVPIIAKNKPDVIINCSWYMGEDFWTSRVNYEYSAATNNLLRNINQFGITRFIGLGSSAEHAYTEINIDKNINKTDYGFSKYVTGIKAANFANEYGIHFNWLRIYQAYGSGEKSERLLPQIMSALKNGGSIKVREPYKELDWIYSLDVSDAVRFLLRNQVNETFVDIGTGVSHTVYNFSQIVAKKLGQDFSKIVFLNEESTTKPQRNVCDPNSILFKAGWHPTYTLETGLEHLIHG